MAELQSRGGDGAAPDPDDELCSLLLGLLRSDDVRVSMEAIIYLESQGDKLEIEAFANLRDTLNHLFLVARQGQSAHTRNMQLTEAREHLRRAFTNPYQTAINRRLKALEKRGWLYHWRRQFVGDDIMAPRERAQRLNAAKRKLVEARTLKGENQIVRSAALFRECFDELESVKTLLKPTRGVLGTRVLFWLMPIAIGVTLFILGQIL